MEGVFGFILMIFGFVFAVGFYFLPAMIAAKRDHKNTTAILMLDLFAGWTFIGWVGALVWAFTNE